MTSQQGVFVNPYTFVPFPEIAESAAYRRAPAGHAGLSKGRLSGRIEVELTARSPLLLRQVRRGEVKKEKDRAGIEREVHLFPRRVFPGGAGKPVPFLPGSGLAGVARSLHELLNGGCLRVFDEGFRPGYRDMAQSRGEEWALALVEKTGPDGRPMSLRLCDRVAWVPAKNLAEVLGGADKVVTGARVHVDPPEEYTTYGRGASGKVTRRRNATERKMVGPGDDWVILVTDAGARAKGKSYFCAAGQLSGESVPVTDDAWRDYGAAVAGADDVRADRGRGALLRNRVETAKVVHEYIRGREEWVGQRHKAHPKLFEGQVVWVRPEGEGPAKVVNKLALAAIWRHDGDVPAGERVPDLLLSCQDAEALCPTCRVFGSAETVEEGGEEAAGDGTGGRGNRRGVSRQHAYRGHLRFSDAHPVGEVRVRRENVAPLGAPRPGAGQFYLEHRNTRPVLDEIPLREWGSRADRPRARRLRGRKAYWLTARHRERPMFRVSESAWNEPIGRSGGTGQGNRAGQRKHPSEKKMTMGVAEAVEAGSRFTFTVRFAGLDTAELGGVLAALDPSLLVGEGAGYAVGGGRPLGFGGCTARVTALEVHDAASRYAGGESPRLTPEQAVEAFRRQADRGVRAIWPAARAALTPDRVEPGQVWYPPKVPIPQRGALTVDQLEAGFEFWKRSGGYALRHSTHPLIPLPRVTDPDQTLEVASRPPQRKSPPGNRPQPRSQPGGQYRGRGSGGYRR
ncbi:TIGR03986 family type III CRISPR-associated RAMP protein [Streptomyces alkaliphilus]|uniref:TIGR03986 family type III CRISPR-associated RAMP protein n=1 Tax=Streptomyces alkaliphilus TaxID=1472722 RepID=UPI0011813D59|nr:TIGR03986 family CRISPR-associated RAMP protein [Streptomyces alkaliphilus]MQS06740.1 TIGR03986 family CRISPR-associated RAMP protein [Streptomyces alkaliphilus]